MTARPTPLEAVYVVAVGLLAAAGFVLGEPWPFLLAAVLTLPAALVAVPGYYLLYGLLALVPGANPSSSSGSGTTGAGGHVVSLVTGGPATWFTLTTHVLGVLVLVAAAVADVVLLRLVRARRAGSPAPPAPAS